jgi:heme exporter protein D
MLVESVALGAIGFLCLMAWGWAQDEPVATVVLLALVVSAVGVTLLLLAIFVLIPVQYWRHRKALREVIRQRGALSDEQRRKALEIYRLAPQTLTYRDPRVVPWWEW